MNHQHNLLEKAQQLDALDPLQHCRQRFHLPQYHPHAEPIYFASHSLGCQPKSVKDNVDAELTAWANMGVLGHFAKADPWWTFHESCLAPMASILGAKPHEVAIMNSLTVNIHLCLASFYRPTAKRHKILIEANAFPSDRYAIASQIQFHGFTPSDAILIAPTTPDSYLIDVDATLEMIHQHADELALVYLGGVHYLTGQRLNMARITHAAHAHGIKVGFDLAHAAATTPLSCHDWQIDFAVWCNYKYINAGPGAIAGAFIHEQHIADKTLPRFAGWWGHDKHTRFNFVESFSPMPSADAWQLSNPPILQLAALKAALAEYTAATPTACWQKTAKMMQFLLDCLAANPNPSITLITPMSPDKHAGLLALRCANAVAVKQKLFDAGIVCDTRQPDVIRISPHPLYNTFSECYRFCEWLNHVNDASVR